MLHRLGLVAVLAFACGGHAHADSPGPQPLPMPSAIPAPQDVAFPGVINLEIDA